MYFNLGLIFIHISQVHATKSLVFAGFLKFFAPFGQLYSPQVIVCILVLFGEFGFRTNLGMGEMVY